MTPLTMPQSASMAQWGAFQPTDLAAYATPQQAAPLGAGDVWGGFQPTADSMNFGQNGAQPTGGFMSGAKSWLSNGQNLGAVVQGISALSSAYLGFQQLKAQKEALGFQKEAFRTNLANSTQSYNTSLEDRIRGRSANPNESDVQAYLSRHSLKKPGG